LNGDVFLGYKGRSILVGGSSFFVPGQEPTVFETRIGKIGLGVCYDMLFPEMARVLGVKGAEIIIFVAGFADLGNIRKYCEVLPVARALENQTYVFFCNGVGTVGKPDHYQLRFFGDSKIVSPMGDVIAESAADSEDVISATIGSGDLEKAVSIFFLYRDRRTDTYAPLLNPYW